MKNSILYNRMQTQVAEVRKDSRSQKEKEKHTIAWKWNENLRKNEMQLLSSMAFGSRFFHAKCFPYDLVF